jgi:hypothetical protein
VELDRVGTISLVGAEDHRLEGVLQMQPGQGAGALVAYDLATAGVADAGAGTADGDAARPAVDGTDEEVPVSWAVDVPSGWKISMPVAVRVPMSTPVSVWTYSFPVLLNFDVAPPPAGLLSFSSRVFHWS